MKIRIYREIIDDKINEVCQSCGNNVGVVWYAPDWLWKKVTGIEDSSGVLCVKCFDTLAWEYLDKHFLYWSCDIRPYPKHAIFHWLRFWLRQIELKRWLKKNK